MRKAIVLTTILLLAVGSVLAATSTWDGSSNGNWDNPLNWDTLPSSGDDIVIPSGMPNYPTVGVDGSYLTLSIDTGASVTLTGALTITGAVTVTGTGTLSVGANTLSAGSVTGTGILNGGTGTVQVQGAFSPGTFNSNTGTVIFDGGSAQTLNTAYTFNNLEISNASGVSTTAAITITVSGSLTVDAGALYTIGGANTTTVRATGTAANAGTIAVVSTAAGVTSMLRVDGASITNSGTITLSASNASATATLRGANGSAIANTGAIRVLNSTGTALVRSGVGGTSTLTGNAFDLNGRTLTIRGIVTAVPHTLGASEILVLNTLGSTFSGGLALNGAGSAVQVGTLTLTVTGLTVTTGTVSVSTGSIAGGSSAVSTGSGGSITYTGAGTLTAGTVTNAGAITLAGGTATTNGVTSSGTIAFTTTGGAAWGVTGNFTSTGTITNSVTNAITVSGNVSITGAFGGTATNSTITMTGVGATINTGVQIGNLTTSGTASVTAVTSALNLAGTLTIGAGTSVSLAGLGAAVTGAGTGGGTLNGGTAGVTISGDFSVTTYSATTGTTSFGGSVVTLTNFTHNSGTAQFTRNGAQALTTNAQSFNNFTVTNSGTDTTTVTGALTVAGNLDVQANQTLAVGNNVLSVTGTTGNAGTITLGTQTATLTGLVTNAAAGVLTGGSGTITLTGGVTSGTFTASSGTTNVGGTFSPATFTHNSGLVVFNGVAAQSFGAYSFNTLQISNAAGVSVSATPVSVAGTLTLTSGALAASTRTLNLSGDLVQGGGSLTFTTGTLTLAGTAAQSLDFSTSTLSALTVTKTGGTATAGSSFSVATYSQTGAGGTFSLPLAYTMSVGTSANVTAGILALTGPYSGSGATFTVGGGAVTVATEAYQTGAMTVSSGTFTQTGVNGGANTVASLSVGGGTCTWDATALGGTLTISGACSQTAGTLAFNNKNVTLGTGISGAFEFYDLVIPAGVTLTPAAASTITVRHSMTIQNTGNYSAANNPSLVLGGANSVAGGTYTDNNGVKVNLGTVNVSGGFSKTLSTAMTATNLTIAGGPLAAGGQTLTVTGNLNLNSGSVTSSGTVSVAGNFASTGGILTSTGTLEFTGGAVQAFNPTGSSFSTISINKSGGSLTASASFAAATLNTAAAAYAISFNGGSATNNVAFNNTGTLTITNGFTFDGGTTGTAPSAKSLAGTIQATGANDLLFGTTPTTITANATLQTTGAGTVTLAGVTVNAGAVLTLGNGAATTVNAGAIDGTATSGLTINTTGAVTINGALGATAMNALTITQSGGTAFQSTTNATTVTLTNTSGTIDFQDAVTIGTLNTAAQNYGVRFGNGGTVTNLATFSNTGSLTIANGFTFNGGAVATQGPKSLAGTVATSNDPLDFGTTAVTLTASTTVSTGSGNIALGPTTSAGFDLVLQSSGTDTIASAALGAGTLDLTGKTGGSVTVAGALTAQALTTAGANYAVTLNGGGTVANLTTFLNTGAVALGNDAGDSLTFTAGVTATVPSGVGIAGTVASGGGAAQHVVLGDADTGITLTAAAVVSAGAGNITLGGTVNGAFGLTLNSTGATTLSAAVGGATPPTSLTLDGGGTAVLNGGSIRTAGNMTVGDAASLGVETTLDSGGGSILFSSTLNAGNHDLILAAGIGAGTTTFTGAVTNLGDGIGAALTAANGITGLVRFSNTLAAASGIQAGNAGNQVRFDGNVTLADGDMGTTISATFFDGLAFSGYDGFSFGALNLSGAAASVTSNGGAVSFATIDGAQDLSVNAGTAGAVSVAGAVGGTTSVGTITIVQSYGTTFSGNLSAAALAVTDTQAGRTVSVLGNLVLSGGNLSASGPTAYHVSLTGASNSVSGTATFANAGNLTLGDADTDVFTFTGGLIATATATNTIRGTISTGGGAGQDLTFDTFTLAGVTTLNAGAGGDLVFSAPVTVPDFAAATDLSVISALVSAAGTSLTVQDGARADILSSTLITLNLLNLPGTNSIADLGSSGFTVGTLSNLGTLRLTGLQGTHTFTTFDTDSGITEYYGAAAGAVFAAGLGAGGNQYWDLRIAVGAGTKILSGAIVILNDLSIAGGVLDVSMGNDYQITVVGNWRNDAGFAGFLARQGAVVFTKPAPTPIEIRGNNAWYIFQCTINDGVILFENNVAQRILPGGIFRIRPASDLVSDALTLSRLTPGSVPPSLPDAAGNPSNPPGVGEDNLFWFFEFQPGAVFDMKYVNVYYSNARAYPVSVPPNVNATPYIDLVTPSNSHYCFKWLDFLYSIYSYTEDEDYDGKIDRIRVTTEGPIDDDFSGFLAEVTGYEIDTSRGENGYFRPASGNPSTYYIYLVEKPYLDTDVTPDWHIVSNATLMDAPLQKFVGTLSRAGGSDWMTPGDGAWPVIGYTLSVPGWGETFVHFSEPVTRNDGISSLDATDFGAGSFTLVSGTAPQTREAVVGLGPYATATLAAGATNLTVTASTRDLGIPPYWEVTYNGQIIGPPAPTYPDPATGYLADPNTYASYGVGPNPGPMTRPDFRLDRGGNNVHRVSDLLISVWPSTTAGSWSAAHTDSWFAWPLWAKDSAYYPEAGTIPDDYTAITDPDAAGMYVGFIRGFDGTRFLRDQDFEMQVEDNLGLGSAPELLYKSNISDTYLSAVPGVWLPDYSEPDFSGLASFPFSGYGTNTGTGSAPVWDYSFFASDPEVYNRAMLEFYFRLPGYPADLYAGRLDMPEGFPATGFPTDWYRRVRPFGIYIRDVVTQRGGVTILNNVIDPTTGERTRLHFTISKAGPVTVTVFTLDGDIVRSLQRGTMTTGDYTLSWDGRNRAGDPVARGMYFIRIVAPGIDEIRKVMVVRY